MNHFKLNVSFFTFSLITIIFLLKCKKYPKPLLCLFYCFNFPKNGLDFVILKRYILITNSFIVVSR